jgi:hypothetical protein
MGNSTSSQYQRGNNAQDTNTQESRSRETLQSQPRVHLTPDAFLQLHEFQRLLVHRNILSQRFQEQTQIAAPLITARTYKPSYLIHKESLAMFEDVSTSTSSPSSLRLHFEFDAQRSCKVKVFYVAVELPTSGPKKPLSERLFTKLLKKGETPSSAADCKRFNAGTRIVFDQRISPSFSSSSSLNLNQYTIEELSHIPKASSSFWKSSHQPNIMSLSQKAFNSLSEIESLQNIIGSEISPEMKVKNIPSMMVPLVILFEDDDITPSSSSSPPSSSSSSLSSSLDVNHNEQKEQREYESYSYFGCFTAYEETGGLSNINLHLNTDISKVPSPVLGVTIFQERLQLGETIYYIKELYGSVASNNEFGGEGEGGEGEGEGGGGGEPTSTTERVVTSTTETTTIEESKNIHSSPKKRDIAVVTKSSPNNFSSTSFHSKDILDGAECVICLTERRTTIVMPCRHLCLCTACAEDLRIMSNKCPVCRGSVHRFLAIDTPSPLSKP